MPLKAKGGIRQRLGLNAPPDEPAVDAGVGASTASSSGLRGGVRSRVGVDSDNGGSSRGKQKCTGPLVGTLKKQWGKGELSARQVEEIVSSASAQGAEGLPTLASPKYPQNLQSSLMSAFGLPVGAPEVFWALAPFKPGKAMHPFLLLHRWIAALYHGLRDRWDKTIQGPDGALATYWNNIGDTAFAKKHPGLVPNDYAPTIPLGLHGDGGAFSSVDSLFVFAFNSLIGAGTTRETRYFMTSVRKSEIIPGTLLALMQIIGWSFNVCLTALMPFIDWANRPIAATQGYLANGWKAVLAEVRGDWGFYTTPDLFGFPKWNEVARMCWLCLASGAGPAEGEDDLRYTHCGRDAPWRKTRLSHERYLRWQLKHGKAAGPICLAVLGLRLECCRIDTLHTVDLGVAAHIIANIMMACISLHVWGSNQDLGIVGLRAALAEFYKLTKCQKKMQGKLTIERIRTQNGWPKLKAKGAVTRHLAPFALQLAESYLGVREQMLCRLLVRCYDFGSGRRPSPVS